MMDRQMSASLDRWLTTDPRADYEPLPPPRCTECGGFLTMKPGRTEPWSQEDQCSGTVSQPCSWDADCGSFTKHAPHSFTVDAGVIEYRTCKKCGATNTWVEP
jgi:hypothetical protein